MRSHSLAVATSFALLLAACRSPVATGATGTSGTVGDYDVVITNARVVDGTGAAWFWGDVGVRGDRIARVAPRGLLAQAGARRRIDAGGLVVAPGFIDIQSGSYANFMTGDGRALSMITQGITTAIMGEGSTPAPVNDHMLAAMTDTAERRRAQAFAGPHGFGNWLESMAARGVSENVGAFVGAGTVRVYAKGSAMGPATAAELDTMRAMVRRAMQDGAVGMGSALIYWPPSRVRSGP